ncbi:unnamed protein product, partial [Polarella glacialis]
MVAVAPSGKKRTFFDLLGVSTAVGLTELRAAFRRCALAAHPDKGGSNEAFQEVFRAFEVLSDVDQRQKYEQSLLRADAADASSLAQPRKRRRQGGDGYSNNNNNNNNNNNHNNNNDNSNNNKKKNGSEEDQVTKDRTTSGQESSRLNQLFVLLEELSPGNRRRVVSECFTQEQRLDLGAWAARQKDAKRRDHPQGAPQSETAGCSAGPHDAATGSACKDVIADCVETDKFEDDSASSDSDADYPFAICDASACVGDEQGGDMHHGGSAGRLPTRVTVRKGIRRNGSGYHAMAFFNFVILFSRTTPDLARALDWLAILTAVSSRSRQILRQQELNFKEVVQGVFFEYQEDITAVGFSVHLRFYKRRWVGNCVMATPITHSLEEADAAIRILAPLQLKTHWKSAPKVGQQIHRQRWQLFKQTYLDVCETLGKCRQAEAARLEGLEAARSLEREAEIERRIQLLLSNWSRSTARRRAQEARDAARDAARSKRDHWKETRAKMRHELTCGMAVRVSVVSISPEVYALKRVCSETGGSFTVALDARHFKELLTSHTAAPPCSATGLVPRLVRMGFPRQVNSEGKAQAACACHLQPRAQLFACPQCHARACTVPCPRQ